MPPLLCLVMGEMVGYQHSATPLSITRVAVAETERLLEQPVQQDLVVVALRIGAVEVMLVAPRPMVPQVVLVS